MLGQAPFAAKRAVVNMIGNGEDNVGEDPRRARDGLSAKGVTINGVGYTNPAPGTRVSAGGYQIVLNDQRREADGSMSITFIRITGSGTEVRAGWAWVLPAEFLDA